MSIRNITEEEARLTNVLRMTTEALKQTTKERDEYAKAADEPAAAHKLERDHQALSNDINDYQNTIAKQRKVLEQALEALRAQPIETREVWKDGIDIDVPVAHSKLCKAAITAIQEVLHE